MEWGLCSASPLLALHLQVTTKRMVQNNVKAAKPVQVNAPVNAMVNALAKKLAPNQKLNLINFN